VKQGYWYDDVSCTLCVCDHDLIKQVEEAKNAEEVEEVF
jgi:hypothetical protein